jgi:hypothetical protein
MNPLVVKDIAKTFSPIVSRRNSSINVQIIPPYKVDLTLTPTVVEQLRKPVDISGRSLFCSLGAL